MIDRKKLLDDLQKLLKKLEADLLERSESAEVPDVGGSCARNSTAAQAAERTAQNFEEWRADAITQAAAAWVLTCVFVRFLEDNQLVDPPKIAGPGERLKRARDEHELYFRAHPHAHRPRLPARGLRRAGEARRDEGRLRRAQPDPRPPQLAERRRGRGLDRVLPADRRRTRACSSTTSPTRSGTPGSWAISTRTSPKTARKKYALLQTPVFVEEFILDRTLDPAIEEFGLAKMGYETRLLPDGRLHPDDRFKMIDPACGSGHFLLGSFARLVDRWRKKDPGAKVVGARAAGPRRRPRRGCEPLCDRDRPVPAACSAALKECGVTRLSDAPGFEIHLACGDSLLHGSFARCQQMFDVADELDHVYQPEDPEALTAAAARQLSRGGRKPAVHHAQGSRPEPGVSGSILDLPHEVFAGGAVPGTNRLARVEGGFTGQITANSFMKREFGKKLIEEFFPRVDLTHVIDTSGGLHPRPRHADGDSVRATSKTGREHASDGDGNSRRDRRRPTILPRGWSGRRSSLRSTSPGSQSEFVSVGDSPRELFHKHPWSIGGGGAAELKEQLRTSRLRHVSDDLSIQLAFVGITRRTMSSSRPSAVFDGRCDPDIHVVQLVDR